MQKILEKIQSGDLNTNQLLQALTQHESDSADEFNTVFDRCVALEAIETSQALEINMLKGRINGSIQVIKEKSALIKELETASVAVIATATNIKNDNTVLKVDAGAAKGLRVENKRLKKQNTRQGEANRNAQARSESMTKENRLLRAEVRRNKSDISRLRMTGHKRMGTYSFTIFPSRIKALVDGVEEFQVNLVAFNKQGAMKIVGLDSEGEVCQPISHVFKFDADQSEFIKDFCKVAREDNHQFTDRVLSLVN